MLPRPFRKSNKIRYHGGFFRLIFPQIRIQTWAYNITVKNKIPQKNIHTFFITKKIEKSDIKITIIIPLLCINISIINWNLTPIVKNVKFASMQTSFGYPTFPIPKQKYSLIYEAIFFNFIGLKNETPIKLKYMCNTEILTQSFIGNFSRVRSLFILVYCLNQRSSPLDLAAM